MTVSDIIKVVSLTPQAKLVLEHLKRRGKISPMEALNVYGINRLASRMSELKAAGIAFDSEMRADDAGTRYKKYTYPARTVN